MSHCSFLDGAFASQGICPPANDLLEALEKR